MAEWVQGHFTVDEGATVVAGEYRTDYRWNGWLCPRMKFDQAEEVLRAIAEESPDYYMVMLVDETTFVLYEYNYADDEGYEPEIHQADDDGWYYVGAMSWCWEEIIYWSPLPGHYPGQDRADVTYVEGRYEGLHCELYENKHTGTWDWSFYAADAGTYDLPVARGAEGTRLEAERALIDYIDGYEER